MVAEDNVQFSPVAVVNATSVSLSAPRIVRKLASSVMVSPNTFDNKDPSAGAVPPPKVSVSVSVVGTTGSCVSVVTGSVSAFLTSSGMVRLPEP